MNLTTVFSYIGAAWFAITIAKVYRFIQIYATRSSLEKYKHHSKDGSAPWAIITGASDGIGKSYAYELASQGFNIVLHGRNQIKLATVRDGLQKEFPKVQIRIVIADAYKGGAESIKDIEGIAKSLKDLHITILINNVGTGARPSDGINFSAYDQDLPSDIDGVINLNLRFPAQFTRALLPILYSHNHPALILNMLSFAANGSPYLSIYSGSKSFLMGWTKALVREMKSEKRPIEILAIMTSRVTDTKIEPSGKKTFLKPTAREFARESLGRVGCGESIIEGWWTHRLLGNVLELLPAWLFSRIFTDAVKEEMRLERKLKKL